MQAALDDDGKVIEVERWSVAVKCDVCEEEIHLDPHDYGIIAGDSLFFYWQVNDESAFTVLRREQVVELVDAGVHGDLCEALGTEWEGISVPPHMRGTYCLSGLSDGGEEE
jgi:hypothetical protein